MKAKHQRLSLALLAVAAIFGAALLAMSALRSQASYFYTPGDIVRDGVPLGRAIRLGGMVVAHSIRREPDGVTIDFKLTDGKDVVPVRFTGITPDLFKEGSGAVAEGRFTAPDLFTADNILAKHDERYMPPEMAKDKDGETVHKSESLKS